MLYTHGGGLDAPLSVTRMEYSDSLPQPMTVFLHRDWRGAHDLGTFAGGNGTQPPCVTIEVTKRLLELHGEDPPDGSDSEHC